MQKLPKLVQKSDKRIGRGIGSGKGGHTVGKGQKGQKTRKRLSVIFQGYKVKKSFIKKLPFRRGKDKFKVTSVRPIIVPLTALELVKESLITIENLVKSNIVEKEALVVGVKILGNGEVKRAFTVQVPTSKEAAKKIEKAGGKVEVVTPKLDNKSEEKVTVKS